jgi:hypothetical protein
MATYSYLFCDLKTGIILGDMPMHGVTFDRLMNKPGNLNASCNLDNGWTENEDILQYTAPAKTALYVYRDDQIVWGGMIWSRTYQSQAKSIQISAQTFESYAYRRICHPSAQGIMTLEMNQSLMVDYFWTLMQMAPNGSINVMSNNRPPGGYPSTDIERERTINPWDLNTYGELIDGITNLDDGCDYTIECYEENGLPRAIVDSYYPRLGRDISSSGVILDYPGCISNYYRTENATGWTNHHFATGEGEGVGMRIGEATDTASQISYPLLEDTNNYAGVTVQLTIDNHAASDMANMAIGSNRFTFQLIATEEPVFGSYLMGDDARVTIEDPWNPNGVEFTTRIVGWSVTPSSSESIEEVSLVLEGDDSAS